MPAGLGRYQKARGSTAERLVSGSQNLTMFLWEPSSSKKQCDNLYSCVAGISAMISDVCLQAALERYQKARGSTAERLVSGSDDFTMFLWEPSLSKKPLQRMTGHVQLINQARLLSPAQLCLFMLCFWYRQMLPSTPRTAHPAGKPNQACSSHAS